MESKSSGDNWGPFSHRRWPENPQFGLHWTENVNRTSNRKIGSENSVERNVSAKIIVHCVQVGGSYYGVWGGQAQSSRRI